ncbi:MAG: hypothetical protein [Podoviridae sp. ctLUJ1]|nr:MAG: hypothetical protein [Podoviridae sp. ctLUJ1]
MSDKTDRLKNLAKLWAVRAMQILLVLMAIASLMILHDAVKQAMAVQAKEGECIARLISLGIPRENIIVNQGSCYLKENAR